MSDRGAETARSVLAELEERLATHDLERMAEFFVDDVLIGDGVENFDRDAALGYLGAMADMEPTVRWDWKRVAGVRAAPGVLSVAAAGTIHFEDRAGTALGDPEPFRLTCVAVQSDGGWRVSHFHGSRPHE